MTDASAASFCPYNGLEPYTSDRHAYFFGRERDVRIIASNLRAAPLTILYGASGVGKSSVLMAGVVPYLERNPRVVVVVYRTWQEAEYLSRLKQTVADTLAEHTGREITVDPALPFDEFLLECRRASRRTLLLVLDQFEEYLASQAPAAAEESFDARFAIVVNSPEIDANLLVSIRADALSRLDRFQGRIPNLLGNRVQLRHLTLEAAREAVTRPLGEYNREYRPDGPPVRDGPGLVDAVLNPLAGGQVDLVPSGRIAAVPPPGELAGGPRIEAPYLQLVMTRLWHEEVDRGSNMLRVETLRGLGGPAKIVGTHLDQVLDTLDGPERRVAAQLFPALVTPTGGKIALTVDDLSLRAEQPRERVESVLTRLSASGARILREVQDTAGRPGVPGYEIFHDVLASAAFIWSQRYSGALEERERLRRWLVWLLLAVMLFLWTGWQWRATERQRQIALAHNIAARSDALRLEHGRLFPASVLLAVESMRRESSSAANEALRAGLALLPHPVALMRHRGPVLTLAYSPDGRYVATGSMDNPVTGSMDNIARIWEATSGRELAQAPHGGPVRMVVFSRDGHYLASASDDGTARVWKVDDNGRLVDNTRVEITLPGRGEAVAFSPDGRYLATASEDGTAQIWKARTGHPVTRPLRHKEAVNWVAFSPDGRSIATACADGTAGVWEVTTGEKIVKLSHLGPVRMVTFSPDGRYLATASEDLTARVWEPGSGRPVTPPLEHQGAVMAVTFSPNGRYLGTASYDRSARVWEIPNGRLVSRMNYQAWVRAVVFSPGGQYVAAASGDESEFSQDTTARVWEAATGREVARMAHEAAVYALAFSPDGYRLATASGDGTARVWGTTGVGQIILKHGSAVGALAYSPDRRYLATASDDGTARVLEVSSGHLIASMKHHSAVRAIGFSPDGRYLATGSEDRTARVWEASSGRPVTPPLKQGGTVYAVAFSPDGRRLVTAGEPHTVRIWDVSRHQEVMHLQHDERVVGVAISPDGQRLAVAGNSPAAKVWDMNNGRPASPPLKHGDAITAIVYSPDGRYLATASRDHSVKVWEASSGRQLALLKHDNDVLAVTFSRDGRYLASGGSDRTARVWEASHWQPVAKLPHEGPVWSVSFSPSGRYLATGSDDYSARVWEWSSGRMLAQMPHQNSVEAVAFSPDGHYLASASLDGTAQERLWRPGELRKATCDRLTHNLTRQEWGQYLPGEQYRLTCPDLGRR